VDTPFLNYYVMKLLMINFNVHALIYTICVKIDV
jgi:hypothetical protein